MGPADAFAEGGRILRRQATFWELEATSDGSRWRAHFERRSERRFVRSELRSVQELEEHPLLRHYTEPWCALYVSSTCAHPNELIGLLAECADRWSDGWRSIDRYLNPTVPASKLLSEGFGELATGPRPLLESLSRLLEDAGCAPSLLRQATSARRRLRVLLLDESYVIARQFAWERLG